MPILSMCDSYSSVGGNCVNYFERLTPLDFFFSVFVFPVSSIRMQRVTEHGKSCQGVILARVSAVFV